MGRYSLGIDIGGTFTDVVAHDHASGRQVSRKILTTHDDPARAVLDAVDDIVRRFDLDPAGFRRVVHATTLFTNALIERRGVPTGLLTTRGFRDVLEIGRERKYDLYEIAIRKPAPLVPRDLRGEVTERIGADGRVLTPLDEADLLAAARALADAGARSLAIVFLHAYLQPAHEQRALAVLREALPQVALTASHEVAPELREYERGSTAVANAYVKPLAERYLDTLATQIRARGIDADVSMMMSSGGLTHLAEARRTPVQMLESGPAAGALAAAHFGAADAGGRLLAFDMGGTTAKLSLVDDGEPLVAYGFEAARQRRFIENSGLPIRISTIELIEIGAGGGSIAHLDALGLLKVGPQSAGSEPGPAAYGRGGDAPTVTDADFALGYLNPDYFAGGTLAIDLDACRAALGALAARAGLDTEGLAWGIHDVVDENMASAARVHIAERGKDPADYALLCTGGAGPVHAWTLARKLGIRHILCPPSAGVASALGLLVAPARVDRVATIGFRLVDGDLGRLEAGYRALEAEAAAVLAEAGLDAGAATVQRLADGRFVGQGFDLVVSLPAGPYDGGDDTATRAALRAAFEAGYREKYQRTPPDVPVEFINVRIAVRLPIEGPPVAGPGTDAGAADPVKGQRAVWFPEGGGFVDTVVLDRTRMRVGDVREGPAVIEDEGSTLVVGPGGRIEVLPSGNLSVRLPGEAAT
ncbi:MAG: hydantoinase/oxoprolinase family protein [Ectothiorhodospiraceae bacterium]|nr:hydantoinase/oxoprolinase family protein [Ectothiorhodospiraceae bacterium]